MCSRNTETCNALSTQQTACVPCVPLVDFYKGLLCFSTSSRSKRINLYRFLGAAQGGAKRIAHEKEQEREKEHPSRRSHQMGPIHNWSTTSGKNHNGSNTTRTRNSEPCCTHKRVHLILSLTIRDLSCTYAARSECVIVFFVHSDHFRMYGCKNLASVQNDVYHSS